MLKPFNKGTMAGEADSPNISEYDVSQLSFAMNDGC